MDLRNSKELKDLLEIVKKDDRIIACTLFGSYAKGNFKKKSDLDICLITREGYIFADFDNIKWSAGEIIDLHYFYKLPDIIRFRVLTEGKVLVLNDRTSYFKLKRRFLHSFRDNYLRYERCVKRMLANV